MFSPPFPQDNIVVLVDGGGSALTLRLGKNIPCMLEILWTLQREGLMIDGDMAHTVVNTIKQLRKMGGEDHQ